MGAGSPSSLPGQWGELFASQYTWRQLVRLPDTSPPAQLIFSGYGYTTSVATGANAVLVPLITQPRSITIDGVDAFAVARRSRQRQRSAGCRRASARRTST